MKHHNPTRLARPLLSSLRVTLGVFVLGATFNSQTAHAQEDVVVVGDLERVSSTSAEEKLEYVTAANTEIDEIVKSITKLVEAARRDGDAEQLQCLAGKLSSVRAMRDISGPAAGNMAALLEAGQLDLADHEYRKIAVAHAKSRQLMAESERCGDSGALRDGSTTLVVEGGEVGSDDDTKAPDYPVEYDVDFDPPDASPFF